MSIKSKDAEQLLANPLLQQAFFNVRENIVCQIEVCPIQDDLLRNQLMLSLQLLISVQDALQEEVNTGYLEENTGETIN